MSGMRCSRRLNFYRDPGQQDTCQRKSALTEQVLHSIAAFPYLQQCTALSPYHVSDYACAAPLAGQSLTGQAGDHAMAAF